MRRVPLPSVRIWVLAALIAGILPLTLPRAATAKVPTPPALLAAPTTTTYVLRGTFTTTNQNMRGPGTTPPKADIPITFFDETWNETDSAGSVTHVDVDPCDPIPGVSCAVKGDFGAEVTATTNGRVAMGMTFKGATTGSVSVTYPVSIGLTVTTDYPANGPKTISIESSLSVDPGAKLTSIAPTYDSVSLDGTFGFHAGISGRLCFFSCVDIPSGEVSLTIPEVSGEIINLPASTFTQLSDQLSTFGLTRCFDDRTNKILGAGPYDNPRCVDRGYVAFPDPKLVSSTNAAGVLTATATDTYGIIPISAVTWAARVAGLDRYPANFGPKEYGDFDLGYTTYNQIWTALFSHEQTFTFDPDIDVRLQLPRAMTYTVRDQGNNIVATNTSSTVTFLAGHKVVITIPNDQPLPISMTPSLAIRTTGANFTSTTVERMSLNFEERVLAAYLKHPGYKISLDFGKLGSVNYTVMPELDLNIGPLYRNSVLLASVPFFTYQPPAWNLAGFNTVQLPPFQPPMLLLSDAGIRGQTQVTAVAPSTVTSFDCVDSRRRLRLQGSDLDASTVRTLIYSGPGWHVITCTVTTVSDGTFIGTFGIYVLSDPHRAAQAPPPPLDFGTPERACNPRGFLLKNDTSKYFNLNSVRLAGPHAGDWFILSGGDTSQMGALQPGYGQVFALQYCKGEDGPRNASFVFTGSLGTGAGRPAPVTIPLVANGPNLTITKLQNTPTPVTNQTMTYTVTARANAQAANGILVRDTLPAGVSFGSVSNNAGFTCANSGNTVDCTGNLAANASVVITITATVTAAAGTTLTNTAVIDPNNTVSETNDNDNTATTTATVTTAPNLTISKSQTPASGSTVATESDVVYTLTVTSNGGASSNVLVRDPLPAGTRFVSVTNNAGFGCILVNTGSGVVECTGNLASGASAQITLKARVTGTPGTTLSNTATVDPNNTVKETNENDNTSNTVTATVVNGLNLTMTKEQSTSAPEKNANLVYTVKAKATGGAANNVLVRDTLPASGVQLLSVTNDALFACPVTANVINCTGNLASGQEVIITITVRVIAQGGTTLTNTATVDPNNTIAETNESAADNTASVTATVPNPLNLTISKTRVGSGNPAPDTNVTYQIVVTAVGGAANQVQVRDILPSGLTFVSVANTAPTAQPTSFFACAAPASATPNRVDCAGNLAAGESVTITLVAKVGSVPNNTVLTNTATVDPDAIIAENNEGDNNSSAQVTVSNP